MNVLVYVYMYIQVVRKKEKFLYRQQVVSKSCDTQLRVFVLGAASPQLWDLGGYT